MKYYICQQQNVYFRDMVYGIATYIDNDTELNLPNGN